MFRAPCCEKMGLKRGPWTAEEDQILVSYIQRFGHGNWRALPKQAGLLRCGKSCRLRWTNYLRPDVKRGNFTREEEETIINSHEMLGNRWSAIAARLPGRTDNEIKNVWHTHLKKRVKPNVPAQKPKRNEGATAATGAESKPITPQPNTDGDYRSYANHSGFASTSTTPQSSSERSNSGTDSSSKDYNSETIAVKEEEFADFSSEQFPMLHESFRSDALWMENFGMSTDMPYGSIATNEPLVSNMLHGDDDDVMDYWLRVMMEVGELPEL